MKTILKFVGIVVAFMAILTVGSCDTDDVYVPYNPSFANALVTVKPNAEGGFFMQLNDSVVLLPANVSQSPYGNKEVRALVNCYRVKDNGQTGAGKFDNSYSVYVNWMDSILTKNIVNFPSENVDELYGNDAVEIVDDWTTVAEDGYLTLRLRTLWGNDGVAHKVNLLYKGIKEGVFQVELRQDAMGDTKGHWGDALVAFNLKDVNMAPQKEAKLALHYLSFSGEKTVTFSLEGRKYDLTSAESSPAPYSARLK